MSYDWVETDDDVVDLEHALKFELVKSIVVIGSIIIGVAILAFLIYNYIV
jgi:hypothetical protein